MRKEIATRLQQECDRLKTIIKPPSGFRSVGQYYQDFGQISDEQVIQILNSRSAQLDGFVCASRSAIGKYSIFLHLSPLMPGASLAPRQKAIMLS